MIPNELAALKPNRQQTLELVADLSQEQLDFSPAPGRWSVGEVLDHLILTEAINRADVEELIARAEAGESTVLRRTFADLDVSIAPIPKRLLPLFEIPFSLMSAVTPKSVTERLAAARWIPFKNPEAATPRPGRPGEELRRELEASCDALVQLIEAHPDLDYAKLIIRHPLLGTNSVVDLLRFVVNHERRHREQIKDVMNHTRFPCG
ncbi:MAG: DinB family protein [Acidobacteria bacterium]|nr:MAG: DinB family protein [Acidobacteriota bacterium]